MHFVTDTLKTVGLPLFSESKRQYEALSSRTPTQADIEHFLDRYQYICVQPTPFCNLDCSYCYLGDRSISSSAMRQRTAGRIGEIALEAGGITCCIWHGGEPLSAGTGHLVQLIDSVNRTAPLLSHVVYSNGTLISQEWVSYAKRADIHHCISLDGPGSLADLRRYRSGAESSERAENGVRLLVEAGLSVDSHCVVRRQHLGHELELMSYFSNLGIQQVAFNFEESDGVNHATNPIQFSEAHQFWMNVASLALDRGDLPQVRELNTWATGTLGSIDRKNHPLTILSDGQIIFASPELGQYGNQFSSFRSGNILEQSLKVCASKWMSSNQFHDFQSGDSRCLEECQYASTCDQRFGANKLSENGTTNSTATVACTQQVMALDAAMQSIARARATFDGAQSLTEIAKAILKRSEQNERQTISFGSGGGPPKQSTATVN